MPMPMLMPVLVLMPLHSHENVASLMGTPARSFLDTYQNQIMELKRNFMTYVKSLRAADIGSRSATVTQTRLQITDDGFPILPTPWKGTRYKKKRAGGMVYFICWAALQYDHV